MSMSDFSKEIRDMIWNYAATIPYDHHLIGEISKPQVPPTDANTRYFLRKTEYAADVTNSSQIRPTWLL